MSIDNSLKTSGGLARHRNVLTRAERVERLVKQDKFDMDSDSPLGLPKVGNRNIVAAGKKKKAATEEE